MNLIGAFLRLVRLPNLLFILLTQVLFYICIMQPGRAELGKALQGMDIPDLLILCAASVFIAAGGYVINDYFDLNIDRVNRPDTVVVGRRIDRRWAMAWHLILSIAGIGLSLWLGLRLSNPFPVLFNGIAVLLLWYYSTTFKRRLLVGNIVIALLTAWVVLVMYVCEAGYPFQVNESGRIGYLKHVYKMAILYGGFAFISTVVREVVKDLEDMEGDSRYGCTTMPIAWGVRSSKVYASVWLIVLFCSILALGMYALLFHRTLFALYLFSAVLWPVWACFDRLRKGMSSADFALASRMMKWVMFNGILSMVFFLLP